MTDHFKKPAEQYGRDLNVIKHYCKDTATYISKMTKQPYEECLEFVKNKVGSGQVGVDPRTMALTRDENGIRRKEVIPFSTYLSDIEKRKLTIAPTLTCYINADEKQSLLSKFILLNVKKRKLSKKEAHAAKQSKQEFLANFKNNEQKSFKISNNSLSGAHASKGTVLFNKSAHPTLTSTCRTATSYANANNEKFLMGNRHYWSAEIVKANILNVINHAPLQKIEAVLKKYDIIPPTVTQTLELIKYSTDLYWINEKELEKIRLLVLSMSEVERASFAYIGDLYHLAKHNDTLVRTLLKKLSTKSEVPVDNPDYYISLLSPDDKAFVSLICTDELKGTSIEELKKNNPKDYLTVASTTKQLINTLDEYQDLITAFWLTDCLTPSVASIRSSMRRAVITSDTDSTIFTTQFWTNWYVGQIDFSTESKNISYAITYLTSQTITHILSTVSAGLGVVKEHLNVLTMKNEFAFPVFSLTTMAKHYYAYINACEGNVYGKFDMEVKGVQLKDSNIPVHIMEKFDNTLKMVMQSVIDCKKISVKTLQRLVANIESDIVKDIKAGGVEYLKSLQIKDITSYVNPQVSNYMHYLMWEDVFSAKYGEAPELPYRAIRVSVDLNNKTKIAEWLDGLEDQVIAERMRQWMDKNNKHNITSLLLPKDVVLAKGMPDEIFAAMNIRKIIFAAVRPFYLLLESLGIYMMNDNLTRLFSDDIEFLNSIEP